MEAEVTYLSVVVPIEKSFEAELIKANQKIRESFGSRWIIDNNFPAHITLWLAYIPVKNVQNVINRIKSIALKIPEMLIKCNSYSVELINNEYIIKLLIEPVEQLTQLHRLFLDELNQFREGYIHPKYLSLLSQFPNDIINQNIKKYGSRFVADIYSPHITFAIVENNAIKRNELDNQLTNFSHIFKNNELIILRQDIQTEVKIFERIKL